MSGLGADFLAAVACFLATITSTLAAITGALAAVACFLAAVAGSCELNCFFNDLCGLGVLSLIAT
ncbi:MAG: hypothetical protein K2I57_08460 [Muribaculaceae bacterium]|nr:hypothetical protein [Muribaculaceae bacterium]